MTCGDDVADAVGGGAKDGDTAAAKVGVDRVVEESCDDVAHKGWEED